jgi:AcrR family transcriptional regulator
VRRNGDVEPGEGGDDATARPASAAGTAADWESVMPLKPSPPPSWHRELLLAGMVDEIAANGCEQASIERVCARAGVPVAAFAESFQGKEECFLVAFDSLLRQLAARTIAAYHAPREPAPTWPQRLRTGLCTCIAGICSRADAARAYMLAAPAISDATRAHRERGMAMFEEVIVEMLQDAPTSGGLAPTTVTAIAGGIWRVIESRLREDRAGELPGLVDNLLAWALSYVYGEAPEPHGGPVDVSALESRVV